MGTLTARDIRLPHYCEHKLPTSCRLSSIPQCCACADERAHASSYSTYIDGIGFVSRGSRWQRYCWFCKEFWANRVEASGLQPAQTRIPDVPDQSEFLRRWYEFHQGYRILIRPDGSIERLAVLGEDFRDVSPGYLPRTMQEMRAGRLHSELAEREARQREQNTGPEQEATPTGPSLEDTLDQLYQTAETEEANIESPSANTGATPQPQPSIVNALRENSHAQAMNPAGLRSREYQNRRIAALRRELHRMRNGIERVIAGLRHLGQDVPDHTEATSRLLELGRTLDTISAPSSHEQAQRVIESVNSLADSVSRATSQTNRTSSAVQARVDEARRAVDEASTHREQAAAELDLAEQDFRSAQSRFRQLQGEQRTMENLTRIFGTREEMIAQGDAYESPIGGMFNRAEERFRVAEGVRQEQRTLRQVLDDEARIEGPGITDEMRRRLNELTSRRRDIWGVPRPRSAQQAPGLLPNPPITDEHNTPLIARSREAQSHDVDARTGLGAPVDAAGTNSSQSTQNPGLTPRSFANTQRIRATLDGLRPEAEANILAGPPGEILDRDPLSDNDRGRDAQYVLTAVIDNATLREILQAELGTDLGTDRLNGIQNAVQSCTLTLADRDLLNVILDSQSAVWDSGLPAERNRRRRLRGEGVTFTPDAHDLAQGGQVVVHDVEMMAECFVMSEHLRSRANLPSPMRDEMLSRLQSGARHSGDRWILNQMLQDQSTLNLARELQTQVGELSQGAQTSLQNAGQHREGTGRVEPERQHPAVQDQLEAQYSVGRAFALAASRRAIHGGPAAVMEQMSNRDNETRVAYQRLLQNGFISSGELSAHFRESPYRPLSLNDFTAAPSATDSEPDLAGEERGLDARDGGRPVEAMGDEEMTMKLDCRICYSQLADIACLPCGHLVMCKWCSEQHSPVMAHDRTRPRRPAGCPVCRKGIRQKVRVFRA